MLTIINTIAYTLSIVAVPLFGWVMHTNSKVNVLSQKHVDLRELIEVKLDSLVDKLDSIEKRQARIEDKLNSVSPRSH